MSATFGKKTSAAPAAFGKKKAPIVRGNAPRQPELSPQALSFLNSERSRADTPFDAAPSYTAPKSQGVSGGKPVFWRRIIAKLIDELAGWALVILFSGGAALATVGTYIEAEKGSMEELAASADFLMYTLMFMVISLVYSITMQASVLQATLGKMAMGIIVTDKHGGKPGLGQIILRETLGRSAANVLPFYAGYMMGAFNKDKKCVHDFVASTQVCTRAVSAAGYVEAFA
ncbi:MAG: RDD family protein [Hyphomonas sp.]|uniref:RDD family protein n=1 Tax=Hyphomonas sp. TaxID=87 RepID=UPI003528E3CA